MAALVRETTQRAAVGMGAPTLADVAARLLPHADHADGERRQRRAQIDLLQMRALAAAGVVHSDAGKLNLDVFV